MAAPKYCRLCKKPLFDQQPHEWHICDACEQQRQAENEQAHEEYWRTREAVGRLIGTTRRKISPADRRAVLEASGGRCAHCGEEPVDGRLVVDHTVPIARGGAHSRENYQALCPDCNAGKYIWINGGVQHRLEALKHRGARQWRERRGITQERRLANQCPACNQFTFHASKDEQGITRRCSRCGREEVRTWRELRQQRGFKWAAIGRREQPAMCENCRKSFREVLVDYVDEQPAPLLCPTCLDPTGWKTIRVVRDGIVLATGKQSDQFSGWRCQG